MREVINIIKYEKNERKEKNKCEIYVRRNDSRNDIMK